MKQLAIFTGTRSEIKKTLRTWMDDRPNLIDFDIVSNMNDHGYVICYLKYEEGVGGL